MSQTDTHNVLVVDDETSVADAYALRLKLRDEFDVETAYGGEEALDTVDDHTEVVLLDRRMPNVSGDEVLEHIRSQEFGCRVIMVTAVTPEFDIVDMPFDDYLCKPIDKDDLFSAIDQQLSFSQYNDDLQEYMSIAGKVGLLEAEKLPEELDDHAEYRRLKSRAAELRERLDDSMTDLDDMELAFSEIDRHADA